MDMGTERTNSTGYISAIARQRCPQCRRGIVYRRPLSMNNLCPVCGMKFDREPGYFSGAIYIGSILSLPVGFGLFYLIAMLFPDLHLGVVGLLAAIGFLPLVPLTLRLSRVIWIDLGKSFSPGEGLAGPPPSEPREEPGPEDPAPPRHRSSIPLVPKGNAGPRVPLSAEVEEEAGVRIDGNS